MGRRRKSGVTDTDRGMKRLTRDLAELASNRYVVAGIRGERGAERRRNTGEPGSRKAVEDGDALTLAEVMTVHEFGSDDGRIPERPTFRPAFDKNRDKYTRELRKGLGRVIDGDSTIDQELGRLGARMAGDIVQEITTITEPPLSPVTIAKKGSDKPLIDTGRARQSVDFEVRSEDG